MEVLFPHQSWACHSGRYSCRGSILLSGNCCIHVSHTETDAHPTGLRLSSSILGWQIFSVSYWTRWLLLFLRWCIWYDSSALFFKPHNHFKGDYWSRKCMTTDESESWPWSFRNTGRFASFQIWDTFWFRGTGRGGRLMRWLCFSPLTLVTTSRKLAQLSIVLQTRG